MADTVCQSPVKHSVVEQGFSQMLSFQDTLDDMQKTLEHDFDLQVAISAEERKTDVDTLKNDPQAILKLQKDAKNKIALHMSKAELRVAEAMSELKDTMKFVVHENLIGDPEVKAKQDHATGMLVILPKALETYKVDVGKLPELASTITDYSQFDVKIYDAMETARLALRVSLQAGREALLNLTRAARQKAKVVQRTSKGKAAKVDPNEDKQDTLAETALTLKTSVGYVINVTLAAGTKDNGLTDKWEKFWKDGEPIVLESATLVADFEAMPVVKATHEILEKSKKEYGCAGITAVAANTKVLTALTTAFPDAGENIQAKLHLLGKGSSEWLKPMFNFQVVNIGKDYISASFPPFGLPHALCVTEGSLFVAGLPFDACGGNGVANKILKVKAMAQEDFAALCSARSAFCCVLKKGRVLVAPAGIMIVLFARSQVKAVRWNMFPTEHRHSTTPQLILRTVTAMLASYPALKEAPGYAELHGYLESEALDL
jgi:hypothetical protein